MKISQALDKIDEKQLFVPAFQREYVWKRDDAKQLVDSLIKEYPTGTMLTWETNNPPELKGPHKYDEKQGAVRILLDGQQRLTTLYMLIRGGLPPYYTAPEILNDTRGLHVNVETRELEYYKKLKMENDPRWQNLTDIFQRKIRAKDVVRALEDKGEEVTRERDDLIDDNVKSIENILDREFPEQTIPVKATIREAIDIFYKVNASGVSLTEAELALAQISGYWPQARDTFKAKLTELESRGYVFKLDFVVYALLACLHHSGSNMRLLHDQANDAPIRAAWKKLEEQTLDYVANIMQSHAFVDHTDEINSVYALIPIIAYCYQQDSHLSEMQIKKLVKWFYYSQIRYRYISQLPQKLDRDLRVIEESDQPFDELLQVIKDERPLEIVADEFVGRAISHPLFPMMRWYFKSQGATCLTTGVKLAQPMGKKYQLENDHIFPFSKLRDAGYGKENRLKYSLAQEITNRAILTQIANRAKSATNAEDYLAEIDDMNPDALAKQCIPSDPELWKIENYEGFLHARRTMLANALNGFLSSITETKEAEAPITLEEMIAEGESEELEFKQTLRWDIKEAKVNKGLEQVVVKTIAAFANSYGGGTLLIGVSDVGEAVGLDNDYASLGDADKDRFEIHLRNLFADAFGQNFTASKLKIAFPEVEGSEICQIDVRPADAAVVISVADKNGLKSEKLYVRSGNSSPEMPMSEVQAFLGKRFGSTALL
ncbi:GmrSD restriction endonuclease domain-containing protein [Pontixanthobacter aquaemixtae]|uniref:DUF262 domain-containing protein n=1 Tax=Pontixanthobacter aquaemixtae TaxID=1958940 RepID=A0A844ZT33_9SPHN|nr:DUF262 domain-containing protein [Pontixanthobacter aquaemixtae]MXO91063.1 DUF262 domain-containing protein [Pontixanthobacter aquaemixtae]